jgi:hypothetical protein
VSRLNAEGFCGLCEEVDARLDAHVASAVADLTERFAELILCYLHVEDVCSIVRAADEGEPKAARLGDVYERSYSYVQARDRRARDFRAGDPPSV